MKVTPSPSDEKARMESLKYYQILDTLPEGDFNDIAYIAAQVCNTPIAVISFFDEERHWFKAKIGINLSEVPRKMAFGGHAILQKDIFVVRDALQDERFRNHPHVIGAPNIRFYAGTPLITPEGHNIGVLCVNDTKVRDINTAEKETLQALARQVMTQLELRLRNVSILRASRLLDHSPAAMFCKDYTSGKGVFVEWNHAAEKLWGVKKKDILGKTDFDLFPKEQAEFFVKKDLETLNSEKMVYIEHETIDTPNKGHLDLRTWKVPVAENEEKPMHLLGISLDITRQGDLERQLLLAKDLAESALKTKTRFLANMSHEIRTPMNGIIGITNLLLSNTKDQKSAEQLKLIQSCSNSLLDIINDVLDFSKLEVAKVELEKTPFPIHGTAKEIVELLNNRASEKGIILSYKQNPNIPAWAIGDSTRFRQILTNLVSNALKFTENGTVEIFSQAERTGETAWKFQFSVKDSGIGIPNEVKNKLFQSFSQVDASTTRKYGGTGLGLAISKGLCEKMGGTIWVDSEVGKGSTFSFTFVADECKAGEIEKPLNPFATLNAQMGKEHPLRILVAEDNRTNQYVAIGLLGKLGYKADIAMNGKEVLQRLETETYDLILMDCHMPEMDGFEATRQIIAKYPDERPMIIALTASTMQEDVDHCYKCGMSGFLSKPITVPALVKALQETKPLSNKKRAVA